MSKNSNRNRHTGRVNAYKRNILEKGEDIILRSGAAYKQIVTRTPWNSQIDIVKTQMIRVG